MIYCDEENLEKSYRDQARECGLEAEKHFRLCRNAYNNGDAEMGKFYCDLAKFYQKYMREANNIAANIIFKINNQNQPLNTIDLHRLFVDEAINKLKDRVNYVKTKGVLQLNVIVGRGNHSKNGPKLKDAVANFASKTNIRYTLDHLNPGRIKLFFENMSRIMPIENEHSSIYIYNRSNQVKLSDYITQTLLKNSTSQNRNGFGDSRHLSIKRKHTTERVSDRSNEGPSSVKKRKNKIKDSTHLSQNTNRFAELETLKTHSLMKRKCNTQRSSDRSNEAPSTVKKSKAKRKNSTRFAQNSNQLLDSGSNGKNACSNEVSSSVIASQRKDSTYIVQSANEYKYRLSEFCSSVCRFVFGFVIIGVMCLALFGL